MASLALGPRIVPLDAVWRALSGAEAGREAAVVWQLRVPRTLLGLLAGAALGTAGALMQALTRNGLADPGLLGVNAGAALAVVATIALAGSADAAMIVPAALGGSLVAATTVFLLGARTGSVHLVLTGAALSASLRAGTGIIALSTAATFDAYRFWVIGSLGQPVAGILGWVAPLVLVCIGLALPLGASLNALALGNELMAGLGGSGRRTRGMCFLLIVLLCGTATAACGPIAFLGLAVPHAVRRLVGPDWRRVVPCSALAGAVLLLAADVLGRVMLRPGELEVGVVTALLGAPLLVLLVARPQRTMGSA